MEVTTEDLVAAAEVAAAALVVAEAGAAAQPAEEMEHMMCVRPPRMTTSCR